jgi:hypothetical protein
MDIPKFTCAPALAFSFISFLGRVFLEKIHTTELAEIDRVFKHFLPVIHCWVTRWRPKNPDSRPPEPEKYTPLYKMYGSAKRSAFRFGADYCRIHTQTDIDGQWDDGYGASLGWSKTRKRKHNILRVFRIFKEIMVDDM